MWKKGEKSYLHVSRTSLSVFNLPQKLHQSFLCPKMSWSLRPPFFKRERAFTYVRDHHQFDLIVCRVPSSMWPQREAVLTKPGLTFSQLFMYVWHLTEKKLNDEKECILLFFLFRRKTLMSRWKTYQKTWECFHCKVLFRDTFYKS